MDKKATAGTTLYYRYYDEAMKARVRRRRRRRTSAFAMTNGSLFFLMDCGVPAGLPRERRPIFALYDLERDPREATDVYASTSTKVVSKLKRELRAAMALYGGESHVKAGAHLPPDCLRSLAPASLSPLRHRRFGHPQDFGTPDFVEWPPNDAVRDAGHDCRGLGEGAAERFARPGRSLWPESRVARQ